MLPLRLWFGLLIQVSYCHCGGRRTQPLMRKQELEPGQLSRMQAGDSLGQTMPASPATMGDNKAIYMGVSGWETSTSGLWRATQTLKYRRGLWKRKIHFWDSFSKSPWCAWLMYLYVRIWQLFSLFWIQTLLKNGVIMYHNFLLFIYLRFWFPDVEGYLSSLSKLRLLYV